MTNKTTKICCTLALLASVVTTSAFSQSKGFEGVNLALGFGATGGKTSYKDANDQYINLDLSAGEINNLIYSGDVSYNFPANNKFFIGIGATYDFNKTDIGNQEVAFGPEIEDSDGNSLDGVIVNAKGRLKNHYSLYLQPAYLVNNTTALFAKIGYHHAKSTYSVDGTGNDYFAVTPESYKKSHSGTGYGIGLKTFLDNSIYIQAEAEYVDYKSKTLDFGDGVSASVKPETVSGRISIGYKF
jgi:opacity protein-like surface antigen